MALDLLNEEIITCRKCPRLVAWREQRKDSALGLNNPANAAHRLTPATAAKAPTLTSPRCNGTEGATRTPTLDTDSISTVVVALSKSDLIENSTTTTTSTSTPPCAQSRFDAAERARIERAFREMCIGENAWD